MRFALAACNSWRRCRLIVCFWLYHLFTCTWVSESAQDQYSVLNAKDVGQCLLIHHKITQPVMSNVVMPLPVQFKISSDHDVYSHAMHKWNTKKPEVFESDVGIIRRNAILAHTHKKTPNYERLLKWTHYLFDPNSLLNSITEKHKESCPIWSPENYLFAIYISRKLWLHYLNPRSPIQPTKPMCSLWEIGCQFVLLDQCAPCARSVVSSSC